MDEATRVQSLIAAGYNPDQYDLADNGEVSQRVNPMQPSIVNKPTPTAPTNSSSTMGAFGRSAASSAIPTAAGLAGGSLAGWGAGAFLAPETGGLSLAIPLIASLAGAMGGGYLASKGQNALLPDSVKEQLAQDQAQHPTATTIGGFAPAMAAFNPVAGLKNLPSVIKSVPKLLGAAPEAITAGEMSNLANTAINTGTTAGQNIYEQNQDTSGKPFDYGSLALNTGLASILNTPTALGKSLGFHSGSDIDAANRIKAQNEQTQIEAARQSNIDSQSNQQPLQTPTPFVQPDTISTLIDPRYAPRTPKEGMLGILKSPQDLAADPRELSRMSAEGGITPTDNSGDLLKEHQYSLMEAEKAKQDLLAEQTKNNQLQAEAAQKQSEAIKAHSANLEEAIKGNQIPLSKPTESAFVPNTIGEETSIPKKDFTGVTEQNNLEAAKESAEDLRLRKLEGNTGDKYSSESSLPTEEPRKPHPYDNLTWEQLPSSFKNKVSNLASKRGISLTQALAIIDPRTGEAKLGKYNEASRTATVSEPIARGDTAPHELGHGLLSDLKNSALPADQVLYKKAIDIAGGDEDTANENLASKIGVKGYDRITGNKNDLGQWFNDFKNRWKNTLGMKMSDGELTDYLSHRLITDAPRGMREEIASPNLEGYNKLATSYKNEPDETKRIAIQKQMEAIKNLPENKGMPPKYQSESALEENKNGTTPETVNLGNRSEELQNNKKSNIHSLPYSTVPVFRSLLDSIRRSSGEEGSKLADAANRYYNQKDNIVGSHMYEINKAGANLSTEQQNNVDRVLTAERRAGKSFRNTLATPDEQKFYDAIRENYKNKQKEQIASKQPITDYDEKGMPFQREAKIDPFYHVNSADPKVLETLRNNPNSATADNLKNDFMDFQKQQGISKEAAQKKLDAILLSNSPSSVLKLKEGGAGNYFKADRIAQGVGLPDSWMKKDLLTKKLSKYYQKVASDRAFHDNIEANPDVAKSIGLTTDPWGKDIESNAKPIGGDDVRTLLENMRGESHSEDSSIIKALNKVATSLMLGPVTNAHIVISSLANAMNYLKPGEALAGYTHALTGLNEHYQEALKNGYIKNDPYKVKDILDNTNTFAERASALSQTINNLSGRKLVNSTIKGLLQGLGEYVVGERIREAGEGNKDSEKFLKNLNPDFNSEKEYSAEDKSKMASTLAGMIHGAHDARTMPRWMLHDSAIQPFFSLASWNIAQTNNFMKHVYTPATQGNFTPLIMSTLGAALGGYALKTIREGITDKKAPFPWLSDLANSSRGVEGNVPLVAYNLMSMASMAGYGGILSMLGKTGFDIAYKNIPQGASFPLDEVMSSSVNTALHAFGALSNAANINEAMPIAMKASMDLARENIQLARIAHTWGSELNPKLMPESNANIQMAKAKNNYRNFRMAEGQPVDEQTPDNSNPYLDLPVKSFKKTEDAGEAMGMLPNLINRALTKANGNPEILQTELKKIKTNNYETMPNPDSMPIEFMKYVSYLQKQKGNDKAMETVRNYMVHNELNKMKGSMVP